MSAREQWILVLLFAFALGFGIGSLKPGDEKNDYGSRNFAMLILIGVGTWAMIEVVMTYA